MFKPKSMMDLAALPTIEKGLKHLFKLLSVVG